MQQGVAVVAARVDGLTEIVADEVTGVLVDPVDPGALAGVLDRLAGDHRLAERMGRNGQRRVAQFDEESMVDRLVQVYTGTTPRRRRVDLVGSPS